MSCPLRLRSAPGLLGVAALLGLSTGCRSVPAQEVAEPSRVTTMALDTPLPSRGRLGGLAVDAAGNVYVSNFGASVWRVRPDGTVDQLAGNLEGTSGNTVLPDGRFLQASFVDNRIVEIGTDGTARTFAARGLSGPIGIVGDSTGRVFVCNCLANSISVLQPDGRVETLAEGDLFDCPNGITVGPDGWIYVVSFNNTQLVGVSPSGGEIRRLATLPGGKNAHIAYAAGGFYVTRIETSELYRVETDGRFQQVVGIAGEGLRDGPLDEAQLAHPNGIATSPDGRFLLINNLDGPWRTDEETSIVIRKVGPLPANRYHGGA